MTIHHTFIGCDIGKQAIDIFDPRTARFCRIDNNEADLSAFAGRLDPAGDLVVLEATGHYDRLLRLCLAQAGISFARVNPKMARRFAEARGRLAKTDRIDARSLAEMGAMFHLAAEAPACPVRERLAALARRRDQLVEARATERRHRGDAFDPAIRAVSAVCVPLGWLYFEAFCVCEKVSRTIWRLAWQMMDLLGATRLSSRVVGTGVGRMI